MLGCSNKQVALQQELPEKPSKYSDIPELFLEGCREPSNAIGLELEAKLVELVENHEKYAECYIKHEVLIDAVRSRQE